MLKLIIGLICSIGSFCLLYIAYHISKIPDVKYKRYKNGLGNVKDVIFGDKMNTKEGVHINDARDSITGKLKTKSSFTNSETKALFSKYWKF